MRSQARRAAPPRRALSVAFLASAHSQRTAVTDVAEHNPYGVERRGIRAARYDLIAVGLRVRVICSPDGLFSPEGAREGLECHAP